MEIKTPVSVIGLVFASAFLTACCQQPQASNGGGSGGGNCHTHNTDRGVIRHCHPHVNGSNHTHNYGGKKVTPRTNYRPQPNPKPQAKPYGGYPSYYDSKKKGYYRGNVDSVIDPYAKNVMRDYRRY